MQPLVIELQQKINDPNCKIMDLMRLALTIAIKLNLNDFKGWINKELNGYGKDDKVPSYRIVDCSLKVKHPLYGLQDFIIKNQEAHGNLTKRPVGMPISQIQALLENAEGSDPFQMEFDSEIRKMLMKGMKPIGLPPVSTVDRSRLVGILEAVKTITLEWSLQLEADGILGNGFVFSEKEKEKAPNITCNITTMHGIIGNIDGGKIQIGDFNSLNKEFERHGVSAENRKELEEIISKANALTGTEKESWVRKGLGWIEKAGLQKPIVDLVKKYLLGF